MLYKSGNDTLVAFPVKQIDNINKQLLESRKNKTDYLKLRKSFNEQKILYDTLNFKLKLYERRIYILDSMNVAKDIVIKRNYNEYMKAVHRYERAEKKTKKYKALTYSVSIIAVLFGITMTQLK